MFYEVFIPSNGRDGFDVTITVEADNWMTALKSGLERTGQGADVIRNVMCDIKEDNTIHVTDASTARVFVLREVDESEPAAPRAAADVTAESAMTQPLPEATPPADVPSLEEMTESEPLDDDDISEFATQKMAPIVPPLTGKKPVLGKTMPGYESREQTMPRHRPVPPPTNAPPPEVTGKFERAASAPRTTPQTGTHAPPPGAAPPPMARQSGAVPTIDPATLSAGPTGTQPLTPTGPAAFSPPPVAAPPPATQSSPQMSVQPTPSPEPEQQAAPTPAVEAPAPAPEPPPLADVPSDPIEEIPLEGGLEERSWTSDDGRMRIGSSTFEALQRDEPEPKVVRETRMPSGQRKAIDIGRNESVSQNALEEVFLEINQIHEGEMSMEQVINYVMDLAMSKIRAEAGSIMFADVNGLELYFATARGPRAQEVMDFRVPMTKGLVGFCAREGVSLAISDAEKDPRFYKEISLKLGYETKNICCAPIQFEGRVYGAIELMNKTQPFTNTEVNVLTYIGRQLAKFVNDLIMAREKI